CADARDYNAQRKTHTVWVKTDGLSAPDRCLQSARVLMAATFEFTSCSENAPESRCLKNGLLGSGGLRLARCREGIGHHCRVLRGHGDPLARPAVWNSNSMEA